jgi:RNA polymerase sigma factor for flagellar operon FliA
MPRKIKSIDINDYIPTVRYWARHFSHRSHQVLDFEDLFIVGMMGLMDAAKKFNHKKAVLFKTYAEFRIRGEIIDELRRQDWMSRSERKKQKIYRTAQANLEQNLGRHPTRQEMAKILPFKPRELDRMCQYDEHESLRTYQEGDLAMDSQHDSVHHAVETQDEVRELMSTLPSLHRLVLVKRYFEDAPISVIASEVGLSEGRISQLHTEALELLRLEADEKLAA